MLIQKSSTKLLGERTLGFVSAHSPCVLGNIQWKLCPCRLRIHHKNSFKSRRMDSSRKTELMSKKSSPKLLAEPTHGFVSADSPCRLTNCKGKRSRCRRNHHRNCLQSWLLDSTGHTAPVHSKIFKENWVVADSEIITKTAFRADSWIRQRT